MSSAAYWPEDKEEEGWSVSFNVAVTPHQYANSHLFFFSLHLHFSASFILQNTLITSITFYNCDKQFHISTVISSLMDNIIAQISLRFSVSILLWRVHPLPLDFIVWAPDPETRGRCWVGWGGWCAQIIRYHSFILCTGLWCAGTSYWLSGNVPALLCVIDEI